MVRILFVRGHCCIRCDLSKAPTMICRAQRRGLYSNAMGYLGGINLAIMVARICQRNKNRHPAALLSQFFTFYSQVVHPRIHSVARVSIVHGSQSIPIFTSCLLRYVRYSIKWKWSKDPLSIAPLTHLKIPLDALVWSPSNPSLKDPRQTGIGTAMVILTPW